MSYFNTPAISMLISQTVLERNDFLRDGSLVCVEEVNSTHYTYGGRE